MRDGWEVRPLPSAPLSAQLLLRPCVAWASRALRRPTVRTAQDAAGGCQHELHMGGHKPARAGELFQRYAICA